MGKIGICLICCLSLFYSCSLMVLDSMELSPSIGGVRVYVESGKEGSYKSAIDQYKSDLEAEGLDVQLRAFSGDAPSLRRELQNWSDGTWSALLVGDFPAYFYRLGGEIFPTDLYFSSPSTEWRDLDGDGFGESHGPLNMTIPVSRITGDDGDVLGYFDKIHRYRAGSLYFSDSALIFKDDDWSSYREGSMFGIEQLAGKVTLVENIATSTHDRYSSEVNGAEKYIYQWIHANPGSLYIQEGRVYVRFDYGDIGTDAVDVGFMNLFNCRAARYTQENLAMSYIMKTDTVLAVTGSTKKGGNFEPLEFHRALAAGRSWSEAFRNWYNKVGVYDDMWYLGMVILGDPALVPGSEYSGSRSGFSDMSRLLSPTHDEKEYFYNLMSDFADSP